MPKRIYEQTVDGVKRAEGEWVKPRRSGFNFICCTCGLTHTMRFRLRNGSIEMSVKGNRKRTATVRRAKKYSRIKKVIRLGG